MVDREWLRDKVNLGHARLESNLSTCKSLKVGAVAVLDKKIIATGYNGVSSGIEHCDDYYQKGGTMDHKEFADKFEIHAEMNVIMDALERGTSLRGSVVYCTHSPCWNCAKHLNRAGVKEVFFATLYHRLTENDISNMNHSFKTTVFRHMLTD